MKNINTPDSPSVDDPLRLSRLGHWVHASRFWWAAGLIAGLLLACAWSSLQTPRYGLDMLIRVGQVGRKVLEQPYDVVMRIQSPGFRQGVLGTLPEGDSLPVRWNAVVVRDTNIIRVHLTGQQADLVPVSKALLDRLTATHNEMMLPLQNELRRLLATPECQADRSVLPSRDAGTDAVDGAAIIAMRKQDGYGLLCKVELEMLLAYPNTRSTVLLEPVATQPEAESRLGKLALLGMVAGAFLGFVLFLGSRFFRPQGRLP